MITENGRIIYSMETWENMIYQYFKKKGYLELQFVDNPNMYVFINVSLDCLYFEVYLNSIEEIVEIYPMLKMKRISYEDTITFFTELESEMKIEE